MYLSPIFCLSFLQHSLSVLTLRIRVLPPCNLLSNDCIQSCPNWFRAIKHKNRLDVYCHRIEVPTDYQKEVTSVICRKIRPGHEKDYNDWMKFVVI